MNDPWRFYSVPAGGRARAEAPSALDDFYTEFEDDIEAEQEQRRAARAAASLAQPDDPKVVAKSVAIARDLNMTPTVVQADIPGYEAVQRMQKARAVGVVPGVSEWLAQPGNAAIASDNLDALRTVIGTARDYSSIGGSPYLDRLRRITPQQADRVMAEKRHAGAADRKKARQVADLMGRASEDAVATGGTLGRLGAMARSRMMSLQGGGGRTVLGLLDAAGVERNSDLAQWFEMRSLASEYQASRPIAGVTTWEKFKEAPTLGGLVSYVVEQGASSAIDMAALANPYGAVAWVGMQSGSTAQSRAANDRRAETAGTDFLISVPTTTASALLERFGMSKIFGSTAKTIIGRIAQAVGAEALTEALQNPMEYAATTVGTKSGFDVWEAIDSGLAGAVAGGGLGGAVRGTVEAVEASQRKLAKLREVMDQSAESETRKRDPGAFRSLMSALTDGDAENLYVPADKIVAFNQDYRNDEFWGSYRDEIEDALESGGEVVIPVADAAARLAGTDQWAGIERDVRASPGGMSLNEIDAAKKDADTLREQADAAAPVQSAPDAPAMLRKSIRDSLMTAGMTPDVADTNAGIVQALFETRATRLGVELTGREFDPVAVQRVLPEGLRAVGAADNLDLVISAMRASVKDAPKETVLDWIVKQGGVLDTGGDIASMGAAPKGMIIERDPAQMTMLAPADGVNDRSLDNVARDAFNEGFIESDSTDALLEAIGRGLRGEAAVRLADQVESQTDAMRRAASDLAQLLDEAGLDQATATKTEIEAAIAAYTAPGGDLFQGGTDPQGSIEFRDGQALIRLFESANLSTFQHEVAHFWLERFKADAEAGATKQTATDWEALKAWFAENDAPMNDDGTIPEAAHEMFARGWERYLMEGKALSTRLQRAFRLFAAWMRSIYRTVRGLNVPITPEVREVMDRMLATDEEIAAAQAEYQTRLLFDDATAAQMGDAAFRDYATLADESRIRANEELLGKVMRSVRARVTKEYRAEETALREEIAAEVDARPVFAALNLLRSKGGPRISKSWLVETYGADVVKALPAGMPVWSDRGDHADTIAEQVGFNSGDAMVRALIDLEQLRQTMRDGGDTRSVRTATIDGETQAVMNERYGDPLADGSIEREAIAAIQNERQGELLALELRQLARRTGNRETPYAFAKRWAEERIASGVVNEVASGAAQYRFTQAAAKAGRAAEQALLKQDFQEAFRQKQVQLLQMAQARAAAAAGERVEKAVKRMGDLAKQRTVKSMDQGYLDQIHAMLEDYEFKRVSQRELNARDSYARWAAEQTALGHDVVAVERLAQKKNWSRLTVDELIALDDAVKQLRHLGRLKRELIDNKNRRDFDEVVGEAIMSAGLLRQRKPKGTFTDPSWWDSVKRGVASLDASLLKMEEVFDWLDKGKFGVFNRVVFKPLVEAQETERRMIDDYMGRMIAAMGSLPKRTVSRLYDKRVIPELVDPATGESAVMTGERLLMMALNVGNAGNFEKLVGGFKWDTQLGSMEGAQATVIEVLNRELTADDWAYVQTVWDTIDELWPAIRDVETRVNGVAPDKIEAVPVATAGGTLRGGYFPVIYDSESRVGQRNLEVEERGLFPASYTRATTRAGSTRERTEFRGPLELTMGVINRHVAEVIHDITHREAVMNADKFLSDTRVQDAVTASLGPEIAGQFRPWLQHIANEWAADREANSRAEKGMKALRTNATVVGIGFRLSTVLMQISGYANSIERIGTVAVARGVMQLRSPDNWRFALDKSLELRGRMSSMDRDIRAASQRLASRQRRALDSVQRFAFHGIGWMDRLVSVGSWLGAYDKALRQGLPEDQAVYEADKAIRQSQGSGAAKDLARVQRGTGKTGEAWKLVTMFYSYASAFYQRQRRLGRDTVEAIRERDLSAMPEILARYFWLYIVPALASQWIAGNGPGEDEDEAQWAMWQITSSAVMAVPVVRDIVGAFGSGFGYKFTPAEGFGRSAVSVYRDAENIAQGEETKRATRNAMEAAGYATGRVPGQFATSTQFLVDVYYDEQNPETIGEWYEGLMKGKVKDD